MACVGDDHGDGRRVDLFDFGKLENLVSEGVHQSTDDAMSARTTQGETMEELGSNFIGSH